MALQDERWRALAAAQSGLITRAQLNSFGVDRWAVRHRIRTERWVAHTATVIGTSTGPLTREQLMWLGVLHAGGDALVGDLTAAEVAGLRNWHRDEVTILVDRTPPRPVDDTEIRFVRTRHPLRAWPRRDRLLPVCQLEPAVLRFAARQESTRTAEGLLAAVTQQQLTSPDRLRVWIDRMKPLRGAPRLRRAIADIDGGAHSVAEIDVRRMCRRFRLALPQRQVKRRDAGGRPRFTDCEWRLADDRIVVLEVDGSFHMAAEHWEEDLARQRALTAPHRLVVRCTARELRDQPSDVARDLRNLGVPPV